jgi:biotin carboxylase
VVHDVGAASPYEVVTACRGECDLVFVWDTTLAHPVRMRRVLEGMAPVVAGSADDPTALACELRRHRVSSLLTFSDRTMPLAAALAPVLEASYHATDVVDALTDKSVQRARLRAGGLSVPRFARVRSAEDVVQAADAVGYPAVVKPCSGGVSRSTYRVGGRAEGIRTMRETLAREDGLIVEEMLVGDRQVAGEGWGDHVSVESVVWRGNVVWSGVTGKFPLAEPFRETGNFFPSTLDNGRVDLVKAEATRAVEALGVRSAVCHTELKLTSAGPRIIEVNGRLGGWTSSLVEQTTGYSLLRAAVCVALDRPPARGPAGTPAGVAFMWMLQPPRWARSVEKIEGLERLRATPGVDMVVPAKGPGTPVDWHAGSLEYVVRVHGVADDHAGLRRLVRTIDADVSVSYSAG